MAVRLKTRWHRSKRSERNRDGSRKEKSQANLCSVVGINIWKLAKETFTRMEKQDFRFREDTQAIDVIAEFCIFMLHITDRMIFGEVTEQERAQYINGIAKEIAKAIEINQIELLGPGDYRNEFIGRLNDRLGNYSECGFDDEEGPAYDFLRYLAKNVSDIMAISDDKWVLEQVMDIEAPELVDRIRPVVRDVFSIKKG
ncbi:MAG: hypothetical protein COB30_019395 [Ectothiorhodospiraceae bacterium]|nr:hypothetical protein [Ectothiorhodospiraceae bacterium]